MPTPKSTTTPATEGQKDKITRLVEEVGSDTLQKLGLTKDDAQRLLNKGGDFKKALAGPIAEAIRRFSTAPNIVIVPDISAVELTAQVKRGVKVGDKELPLTHLDSDYEKWGFYGGVDGKPISGRGKKFEAMIWKPELKSGETITSEAVREHFRKLVFYGHAGAFTAWRKTCGLSGYHASIPEDAGCWRYSGGLYVPYSIFVGDRRELYHGWLGDGWDGRWSFVAFCEIS